MQGFEFFDTPEGLEQFGGVIWELEEALAAEGFSPDEIAGNMDEFREMLEQYQGVMDEVKGELGAALAAEGLSPEEIEATLNEIQNKVDAGMMGMMEQTIKGGLEGMTPEELEAIQETWATQIQGEIVQTVAEAMGLEVPYASTPANAELGGEVERRAGEIDDIHVDEVNKAPTMEVQARELGEYFRETPELQYENWCEMTLDERLDAMQKLENEAAAIAHRQPMVVSVESLGEGYLGFQKGEGLTINTDYVMSANFDNYVEVINTVIHEGRHAYQMENIALAEAGEGVLEQNTEWINAWRVNVLDLGYNEASARAFDGMGFERYYTQPIEVDARAFAAQAVHEMGLR